MAEGTRLKSLEEQLRRHDAKFVELNELLHKQATDTSKKIENLEAKFDTKFDNLVVKIESMFRGMNKERIPGDEGVYTASKLPILPTPDSSLKKWGETAIEVTVEEALEAEKYEHDCVEGNHQEVECQVFDQSSHWMVDGLKKLNEEDSVTQLNGQQDFIICSPEDSWDLKDHLVLNWEKIDNVGSILVKETGIYEINLEKFGNGLGNIVEHVLQRIHGELGVVTWEEDQKIDKAWDEEITTIFRFLLLLRENWEEMDIHLCNS